MGGVRPAQKPRCVRIVEADTSRKDTRKKFHQRSTEKEAARGTGPGVEVVMHPMSGETPDISMTERAWWL
jgi:hypothetical protein